MTIVSSRRRTTWRVRSALAAVAGSAVVAAAVMARRRAGRVVEAHGGSAAAGAPDPALRLEPGTAETTAAPSPSSDDVDVDVDVHTEVPSPAASHAPAPAASHASTFPPAAPSRPRSAPASTPQQDRPARWRWQLVVVAAVVLAAGLVGVVAVATDESGDQPQAAAESELDDEAPAQPVTTAVDDLTADQAFAQASRRLESAGSFAYSGTSQATDVSPVRPGLWLGVELSSTGEVHLPSGRLHDIAMAPDGGSTETVTDGVTVWGRLASDPDDLAAQPYQTVGELVGESPRLMGAALVPLWLEASTDRQPVTTAGADQARREFRAVLAADVLGEIEDGRPAVDAEILLTLDPSGDPVHVEITTAPGGPPLRLILDITQIGESGVIDVPGDEVAMPGDQQAAP